MRFLLVLVLGLLTFSGMAQEAHALKNDTFDAAKLEKDLKTVIEKYDLPATFGGRKDPKNPNFLQALYDLDNVLYFQQIVVHDEEDLANVQKIQNYYLYLLQQYWTQSKFAAEIDLDVVEYYEEPIPGKPQIITLPGTRNVIFKLKTTDPQTPFGQHLKEIASTFKTYPVVFAPAAFFIKSGINAAFFPAGKGYLQSFFLGPKVFQELLTAKSLADLNQNPVWAHEVFHGKKFYDEQQGKFTIVTGQSINTDSGHILHFDETYANFISTKLYLTQLKDELAHLDPQDQQQLQRIKSGYLEVTRKINLVLGHLQDTISLTAMGINALINSAYQIPTNSGVISFAPFDEAETYLCIQFITRTPAEGGFYQNNFIYMLPFKLFPNAKNEDIVTAAKKFMNVIGQQHTYFLAFAQQMQEFADTWAKFLDPVIRAQSYITPETIARLQKIKVPSSIKLASLQPDQLVKTDVVENAIKNKERIDYKTPVSQIDAPMGKIEDLSNALKKELHLDQPAPPRP